MYQLYYSPGSCSMSIHVILNELDAAVELKNVSIREGKNKAPEFLALNPRGQVPVLVDGNLILREGAAIILYLCDKHDSALFPHHGFEKAQALEWLCWANASLHPAYSRVFWLMRNSESGVVQEKLLEAALQDIETKWADLDAHLAGKKYVAGDVLTAPDILLAVIANWNGYFPRPIPLGNNVERLIRAVITRPAYQKALLAEHVEYTAVAA
ncbi:MAG: glutathione S-transferase family protein [Holosporales bacterium]|jgi:glutathione S-transferase